jgi:uncharacterized membrane protein
MTNSKTKTITLTAMFLALLIVVQLVTSQFGNTIVTGSGVNLMLILAAVVCGALPATAVAIISPVVATLLGIGPAWPLVPFIALGNLTIVLVWALIARREKPNKLAARIISLALGAVLKFAVLYGTVVKLAIPLIIKAPEPQATVMGAAFSIPQLITAAVGGVLAILVLPIIEKATK